MSLVALASLGNPAVNVYVESSQVCALEAIPTGGTRISVSRGASDLTAGPFVDVVGTPAAVAAAITAGGVSAVAVRGVAIFDGATPAIVSGLGTLAGAAIARIGAVGEWTITPAAPFVLPAFLAVTGANGNAEIVQTDGPAGATQDVTAFDAAGAPADTSFVLIDFGAF